MEEVIASARLANMACKVSVSAKAATAVLASSSQRDRRFSQISTDQPLWRALLLPRREQSHPWFTGRQVVWLWRLPTPS